MKFERLKETVTAFMDFAKGTNDDLLVSMAKLDYDVKEGRTDIMSREELGEAFEFVKANYFEVVAARNSGNYEKVDKLMKSWCGDADEGTPEEAGGE